MSEDELRRRIEAAILGRTATTGAQAVIDEFGLTVETITGHEQDECGCGSSSYPAESRVVGRWEEA